jgi:L-amino acid N-acyltransferase
MEKRYQFNDKELLIRPVLINDLPAILNIYNHFVVNSNYTMDTESKTMTDMIAWHESHQERFPAFVGIVSNTIIGYSSLSKWAERKGYHPSCEASLYLSPVDLAQGLGDVFMQHLDEVAKKNNFTTILSFMTSTNKLAKNLARRNGYIYIGMMQRVAEKFGRFVDITMYQKFLDSNGV